ncbi:Suppressor of the cold-sensitive snRNP biogenesis mutant brr1-1 [Rhizophlyctis rosea]|nr:Suppressor of the cold-sensitive snRNP biogenesis mutant brr1-1 [Rhizophlyctis rosea]
MAAKHNFVKVLEGLLQKYPEPASLANSHDTSKAIFASARKGYPDIVRLLCERGGTDQITGLHPLHSGSDAGHPNQADYGRGGIRAASAYGHVHVVRYLLDHQQYEPKLLETALTEAIVNEHLDIVEVFVNRQPAHIPSYALKKAVEAANEGIVRALLQGNNELWDINKAYRRAKELKKLTRDRDGKFLALMGVLEEAGGRPGPSQTSSKKRKRENEFVRLSKYMPEVKTGVFYGGTTIQSDRDKLANKKPQIVVGTPFLFLSRRQKDKMHFLRSLRKMGQNAFRFRQQASTDAPPYPHTTLPVNASSSTPSYSLTLQGLLERVVGWEEGSEDLECGVRRRKVEAGLRGTGEGVGGGNKNRKAEEEEEEAGALPSQQQQPSKPPFSLTPINTQHHDPSPNIDTNPLLHRYIPYLPPEIILIIARMSVMAPKIRATCRSFRKLKMYDPHAPERALIDTYRWAVAKDLSEVIKVFGSEGPQDLKPEDMIDVIQWAAHNGRLDMVDLYMDRSFGFDPTLPDVQLRTDMSPEAMNLKQALLYIAARKGHIDIVKFLDVEGF